MLETTYRAARCRVRELVDTLNDEQLRSHVPATPRWTVHELLAHLVGCAADAISGRLDGVTSDQWTARHVRERRRTPVGELMDEWDRIGADADATLTDDQLYGPNLAIDTVCHEADLREALGLPPADRECWQPFLDVTMRYLGRQLRDAPSMLIEDEDGQQWSCGSGEPTTLLRADGYELLRANLSRRSLQQIAAWDWAPAPTDEMINGFGVFGTRVDDQPIPTR
ncbi:maleylpyruvate isomerase family mycothiol-dependent enzyme [Mycolicibacterium sp. P1-5]|uniref:maleylpyruvate isomerase family mycothiol-dependent enzyme n=1 Tax=Mycolicibacterium sp. P1-5 TaxID=2024617 RepID=UPI0011EF5E2C|nr:maleylpyruvate isomerase family mycothiol-dependent enzyme [Mycolicibacterium sp. P1-5]KAA0103483.1 maleylpyruvate isomerase family mycothiol-dependent enzyme [Mycolicibacterium sp. P1-5]